MYDLFWGIYEKGVEIEGIDNNVDVRLTRSSLMRLQPLVQVMKTCNLSFSCLFVDNKRNLRSGESNPGRPRDRRKYLTTILLRIHHNLPIYIFNTPIEQEIKSSKWRSKRRKIDYFVFIFIQKTIKFQYCRFWERRA